VNNMPPQDLRVFKHAARRASFRDAGNNWSLTPCEFLLEGSLIRSRVSRRMGTHEATGGGGTGWAFHWTGSTSTVARSPLDILTELAALAW
jgi:hypothetical protein